MFNHLAVCYDFTAVNDPSKTDSAFAGGPFMLFRRSGYEKAVTKQLPGKLLKMWN